MRVVISRALPVLLMAGAACGDLGYSSRVLHRVPSPGGRLVAVCQEIPEFDGPGYDVRLEDPGGRTRAHVFRGFDSDQCDEIVWSDDGDTLAVLTRYRAHVRLIDVSESLAPRPADDRRPGAKAFPTPAFVTESAFSSEAADRRGWGLRFVSPGRFELSVCAYDWENYKQTRQFHCTDAVRTEHVAVAERLEG